MRCELSFDAGASVNDRSRGGGRLVEIVDDEMRRVAIAGEREVIVLTEPGMYGAIVKLEDERTLTKAFEVREGDTHLAIRFQEPSGRADGTGGDRVPPKRRRRFVLVAILFLLPAIALSITLLSPRLEMTTISSEAPKRAAPPGEARTEPDGARRPTVARHVAKEASDSLEEMSVAKIRALEELARARTRALEDMGLATATDRATNRANADSRVLRDAIARWERPGASGPPTAEAPSAPTAGTEAPGRQASLPDATENVTETAARHSLPWLPILLGAAATLIAAATALIGFRSLGGGLAIGGRGAATPAGGSVIPDPTWLEKLVPLRPFAATSRVRVAVVYVRGFELRLHLPDAKPRRVGDRFAFTRNAGSTGLPRVEIALPGQLRGLAVMLPLAENDDAEIEIREASGSHPHAHIIFGDADVQQMLRYRDNYCLEESAEIAASVIARLSEAPIEQPAGLATSLYFMLRAGRLPLDAIAGPAERLAREHAWLPDAHAILGEIAARQARHEDALISFLKVGTLGPPFATAGMTYLSDRLSLYDAHLEGGLKLPEMRQPLDLLLRDVREVTRRMVAGRVITTFAIGEPTQPLAISS